MISKGLPHQSLTKYLESEVSMNYKKFETIKLTKQFIQDNLFRADGNLNQRKFNWYTENGIDRITSEDVYNAYHEQIIPKICENKKCWKSAIYIGFKKGYHRHCSIQCGTSNPLRQAKYVETCKKLYGTTNRLSGIKNSANTMKSTEQYILDSQKRHGTRFLYPKTIFNGADKNVIITCRIHGDFPQNAINHTNGNICPKCAKIRAKRKMNNKRKTVKTFTAYMEYRRLVRMETNKNANKVPNIEMRSPEWHLDHRYSISEGYKNRILPYIIGSLPNLEIIHKSVNCAKSTKCSVTLDSLYSRCST